MTAVKISSRRWWIRKRRKGVRGGDRRRKEEQEQWNRNNVRGGMMQNRTRVSSRDGMKGGATRQMTLPHSLKAVGHVWPIWRQRSGQGAGGASLDTVPPWSGRDCWTDQPRSVTQVRRHEVFDGEYSAAFLVAGWKWLLGTRRTLVEKTAELCKLI
jgi:hypothetical protein